MSLGAARGGLGDDALVRRTRGHYDRHPLEFIGGAAVDIRTLQPPPFLRFAETWLRAGQRVLDVGCGPGRALLLLESLGLKPVACDLSEVSLRLATSRAPGSRLVQADALRLPMRDGVFDAVVCDGVLHHTPDAAGGFREIARVVRPGGVIYLSVYKRWRYYRYLYTYVGGLVRWIHTRPGGRSLIETTLLPLYHAVHLVKSRGARTWEGSRNFFYDYFLTPRATFHSRAEVLAWAGRAGATLVSDDRDLWSNSHSFVFRREEQVEADERAQ